MFRPVHARLGRAALGWSFLELERRTGVSKNTLVRFEAGGGVHHSTASKIEGALSKEGLVFLYEDDSRGPGILLSKELSRRFSHPLEGQSKKLPRKRHSKTK
jgi:transcriptional regulator with XRE-family HTH domain